jgi:hypothetical protein
LRDDVRARRWRAAAKYYRDGISGLPVKSTRLYGGHVIARGEKRERADSLLQDLSQCARLLQYFARGSQR